MTFGVPTRSVLGFVLLQIAVFQWALWSYLSGQTHMVVTATALSFAALVGGLLMVYRSNRKQGANRTPARQADRSTAPAPGTKENLPPSAADQNRALLLGTLGFAVSFMTWGLLSPIALEFKEMYALTDTEVSLLIAIPVLLGSVGRLPMGMLADRFGPRRVHMWLLVALILPLIMMGFARSYATLLLGAFLVGLGGTSFAVGIPYVSRFFPPEKQGLALGIYGAGNIGQAVGAFLSPRIAAGMGWQWSFWLMVLPVAIMWGLFLVLGKEAPPRRAPSAAGGRSVWLDPNMWLLSVFYFVTFGGFVAFGNYLPKLFVELHGMTKATAGTYTAGFVVVATALRPVGGWLSDRFGAQRILLVVFATVILGGLLLATEPGLPLFLALMAALAISLGAGNGAVFKLVPHYFPGRTGVVTGVVGAMGGLGGFFPPLVMGLLRDHVGDYALGFIFLAAFGLAAMLGVLSLVWRSGNRQPVPVPSKS